MATVEDNLLELAQAAKMIREGDKLNAQKVLVPYVRRVPDDAHGWWLLANAAARKDQAIFALNKALEIDPDHDKAATLLAQMEGSKIESIKPIPKRDKLEKAHTLIHDGKKAQAAVILAPIVSAQPNDAEAWWLLANATPSNATAINALQNVIRLQPHNERARTMLAQITASNIKLSEAQERFDAAVGEFGAKFVHCSNCGARTEYFEGVVVDQCAFCTSRQLAYDDANSIEDDIPAELIIPFNIDAAKCTELAYAWFDKMWMVPDDIKAQVKLGIFTPVFLPFWAFSAHVTGSWKAIEYGEEGARDRVVKQGSINQDIDNILIPATARVGEVLVKEVSNYNIHLAAPYRDDRVGKVQQHLPEIPAYDVIDPAHVKVVRVLRSEIRQRELTFINYDELKVYPRYSAEDFQLAMVPAYLATYRYNDRVLKVMVNGQTGYISGQRPVDWVKVWGVLAIITLPAIFMVIAANLFPTLELVAMFLVLTAVLVDILVLYTAFRQDDL